MKSKVEPELYKSIVAYDGTGFRGFQRQADSERTVQAVLESALQTVGWGGNSLQAAGRTDAGVHAHGQVIAYRMRWRHTAEKLSAALNSALPDDVAVRHTELAPPDFHPRFSASGRNYRYRLLTEPLPDPFQERYAWRLWPAPDQRRLAKLAQLFVGQRDFGGFGRAPKPGGHTIRQVRRAEWLRQDQWLVFAIEADAFLYRMVRRIVGSMVEVGFGVGGDDRIQRALQDPTQFWNGRVAPARGLFLDMVEYGKQSERVAENILSEA